MTSPVTHWQLKNRTLDLTQGPLWMGILNVTPDSFSDGGEHQHVTQAVQHALKLIQDGAAIIDIGGESTRPYSASVATEEELKRTIPVIQQLRNLSNVPISIDTSKAEVAAQAIEAGADIINDITGLEGDSKMVQVARSSEAGVCVMHMQGTPQTMQDAPHYGDVVQEVLDYLKTRKAKLVEAGISPARLCLDPGVGFGKTHQHNLDLMAAAGQFHQLGCPVLVGHSRKGFVGTVLGDKDCERDSGTAGASIALALQGIQIIRVHDVATAARTWKLFQAVGKGTTTAVQLS